MVRHVRRILLRLLSGVFKGLSSIWLRCGRACVVLWNLLRLLLEVYGIRAVGLFTMHLRDDYIV